MWQNFSHNFIAKKYWMVLALPAWVFFSFMLSQVLIFLIFRGLIALGMPIQELNDNIFNALIGALIYGFTIALVIVVPLKVRKSLTSRKDLGLDRFPNWVDILITPLAFAVYIIASAILLSIATSLNIVPLDQVQDTGFSNLLRGYEYVLAFLTLVVLAPVAEEILFRGYLFGKLRKYVPVWLAILVTSLLFAAVHGLWNVGIDVFALSIVLCILRLITGSLWAPILLHMLKNFVAFYLLFINPGLLSTLGG